MRAFLYRVKRSVCRRLYYMIGIRLKSSVQSQRAQKIRYWMASHFIEHCGKNVSFERGAKFNPELSIGDYSVLV